MVFILKQKDSGKFLITDIIYFIFSNFHNFYAPSIFNPQSFVHVIDKNSEFKVLQSISSLYILQFYILYQSSFSNWYLLAYVIEESYISIH